MSKDPRKRAKTPFQPSQEVTIPLDAVCGGSGSSYGSPPAYPYETLNGQPIEQVDPIQVGPTG